MNVTEIPQDPPPRVFQPFSIRIDIHTYEEMERLRLLVVHGEGGILEELYNLLEDKARSLRR